MMIDINPNFYYRTFWNQLVAVTIIFSGLIIYGASKPLLIGYFIGSILITLNVLLICWSLKSLFLKKYIALSIGVIVFKWAILAFILYFYKEKYKENMTGLLLGLATVAPGVLLWLITENPFKESD